MPRPLLKYRDTLYLLEIIQRLQRRRFAEQDPPLDEVWQEGVGLVRYVAAMIE